jgi:phosphate transport system protein
MPLYEERLSRDLARIRDDVASLADAVQKAVENAVQAMLTGNRKLANTTVLGDHPINRQTREINRLCHAFLAVHLPSSGHLRVISSILRLVNELERIGDYAATIGREALQLPHTPIGLLKQEMEDMAAQASDNLRQAVAAFNRKDAELARETMAMAAQAKSHGDLVFKELVEESEQTAETIQYLFDALIIVGRLKRVSDRAKNICEETLFSVTGETKKPKAYSLLFLDEENNCQSLIAEAVARKTFPNGGQYSSAGRRGDAELRPGLLQFMESHGLAPGALVPKKLDPDVNKTAAYDVVVSVNGPIASYLPDQPFRTVFLEWDVGGPPESSDEAEANERYLEIYRQVTVHIRELMETLRGEEAD